MPHLTPDRAGRPALPATALLPAGLAPKRMLSSAVWRHDRNRRAALLASVAFGVSLAAGSPAAAQDAGWRAAPVSGDFNAAVNWSPATVPTGTAFFGASNTTALSFSAAITVVGGFTFNAGAPAYTFTIGSGRLLELTGAGVINNSSNAPTFLNSNALFFSNASTAGNATITNSGDGFLDFNDTSTAGSATITNGGTSNLRFFGTSTAGNATITHSGSGFLQFFGTSTAAAPDHQRRRLPRVRPPARRAAPPSPTTTV